MVQKPGQSPNKPVSTFARGEDLKIRSEIDSYSSYGSVRLLEVEEMTQEKMHEVFGRYKWKPYNSDKEGKNHFVKWINSEDGKNPDKKSKLNCWEGGIIALYVLGKLSKEDVKEAYNQGKSIRSKEGT